MADETRKPLTIAASAMNRTAFDFIGRNAGIENNCLLLENALVLDYDDRRILKRLVPLQLPLGTAEIMQKPSITRIPLEGIAYTVDLPPEGDDWLHLEYERVFAECKDWVENFEKVFGPRDA